MEGIELICFQIISAVGMARSSFIEAIKEARKFNFENAATKIKEGDEYFVKGHQCHAELIQQEASGNHLQPNLLLIHAEDQMMSAETIKILAEELIYNYTEMNKLKK